MKEVIKKVLLENNLTRQHKSCSQYGGALNVFCLNLKSLSGELYKDSGLGMKKIINDTLESHKTNVPKKDIEKYTEGLRILYRTGKYNRQYIIDIKKELDDFKRVHQDDNWHFVNKLNTNHGDLAELLTKVFSENYDTKEIVSINNMFSNIGSMVGSDLSYYKMTPKAIINYLRKLIQPIKTSIQNVSLEELKTFTRNTIQTSDYGELSEKQAIDYLESKGINILYNGGNGDFIDMKFGVDIIAGTDDGLKLIQVKSSEYFKPTDIRPEIDWVCIATSQGLVFYENHNLSEKNVVIYNNEPMSKII